MSTIDIEALPETEELSPSEQAAIERIVSEGELPQSELWKALDLSSRGGSRIAQSLADKGVIEREETIYEGRTTYLLTPTDHPPQSDTNTTAPEETSSPSPSPSTSTSTSAAAQATRETAVTDNDDGGIERYGLTAAGTHQHHDGEAPTATRETATGADQSLSAREQRALAVIEREGTLAQSELWKELGITSRTGSRVATSLEDQGLIEREQTVYDGQRTYLLSPQRDPAELDFSLLIAGNRLSLLIGEDTLDPIASDAFTQWLLQLATESEGQ
jgi:DNA-binding MarR family transcriptional regulator